MTSPLVAETAGAATAVAGLGVVEEAHRITEGIRNRDWVDATLGGAGVSLEALSLAFDPLSALLSWGVGWLMEHIRPLRETLDWLAGNAGEIAAQTATWTNIAGFTEAARAELDERIGLEAGGWSGAAGDAYRAHAGDQLTVLGGIATAAAGISGAVEGAGLLVALVREIVRDLLADFVATLAARLPQWLAAEGLTLGLATPVVVSQVAGLVASWVDRIQHFVRSLLASLRRLLPEISRLDGVLAALGRLAAWLAQADPMRRTGSGSGSGPPPMPPRPGPLWRAPDDIPGPARGKELRPPNSRHTLAGVRHGLIRSDNSVILRGNEDAVHDDIAGIATGGASWNGQTGRYEINGRTYGVEPNGTVFPDSGPGIARLDRNEYAALKEIARADGAMEKVVAFQRDPRFLSHPEAITKAKSIYDGTWTS